MRSVPHSIRSRRTVACRDSQVELADYDKESVLVGFVTADRQMYFFGIIIATAILIWSAVFFRARPAVPKHAIVWGTLGVLVTGTIFGFHFFHRDIGPIPVTIDRLLLGIVFAVWIYGFVSFRRSAIVFDKLDMAVVIWFAVLLCSTFLTDWGYKDKLPLSRFLFFNAMPVAVYAIVKHGRYETGGFATVTWGLGVLGVYLGLTAIAEWQQWYGLVFPKIIASLDYPEFLGRGRGPLMNPVINGMIMTVCACALLVRITSLKWPMRVVVGCAIVAISGGVFCTLTRSVWMAFIVSVLMIGLAPLTWKTRAKVLVACGLAGVLFYAAIGPALESFKRDQFVTKSEMAESLKLRPLLAVVAFEMFRDHPMCGVGFGQYGKFKKPYHQIDGYDQPLRTAVPYMQHNVVLSYLTETGVLGIAALFGLWSMIVVSAGKVWSNRSLPTANRTWGLVTLAFIINYLINGMFHDVSIIPMANTYLLYFAGLSGALASEARSVVSKAPSVNNNPVWSGLFGKLSARA